MERAQGVAVPRIMYGHSMGERWWPDEPVMADGVFKSKWSVLHSRRHPQAEESRRDKRQLPLGE